MNRLMTWPLLCGLFGLALAPAALKAGDFTGDTYVNNAIVSYPGTEPYPPMIDATNFINNASFTINFLSLTLQNEFYETWDTVNYTNIGSMVVNSGFLFDNQSSASGAHNMSGSFYNPGTISCASINNSSDPLLGEFSFLGFDRCIVNATNIVNPGKVEMGVNGLIQFTGQNVDLSRSLLNIEGAGANAASLGIFDLNTNLWYPSAFLGPNYAVSAGIPVGQPLFFANFYGAMYLTNSTAYINQTSVGTNTVITRAVFLEDNSASNVTASVYFNPVSFALPGNADVAVQWAGTYLDSASGNNYTNYLYLSDNIALGASTNVLPAAFWPNGLPINFTFTASTTPVIFSLPAPAGFLNVFPPGGITNLYDFADVQLLSSVSTNSVATHSVTNLPGRIQISGSGTVDLTLAQLTGLNYMSVQSTNQFNGSAGAFIQTPYADLNLGVTNGFLTLTNVMQGVIPNWGGEVQLWNTRWLAVDSTTGITNDFRVLIVGSVLTPTTLAQVQDLFLHGTNSIVISDALNVMRNFSADAQSLTLTTNPPGNGATSLEGELNLQSPSIFWQSALPNLRYLTNNGAIRMQNLAYFGRPWFTNMTAGTTQVVSYLDNTAFINHGIFSDQGSIIYAGNFENSSVVSNGVGSFMLQSLTTTLTNGLVFAGGDISITASNLVTSNLVMQAGRSLTLTATNLLTDTGPNPTNSSIWMVGSNSVNSGLNLPVKPRSGDLLGTTITLFAPTNQSIVNVWAGVDRGLSTAGYTNNEAIGQLILDVPTPVYGGHNGVLVFNGAGTNNALYVDSLQLVDYATQGNATNNYNFPWLQINTNMTIYYAQALENGVSVAAAIDRQSKNGANGGRLRWIYSYAGYYSSTNLVYTNLDGTTYTNTVNTALAQSSQIDSDGDGIPNSVDPTPFFMPSEVNFTVSVTNLPPLSAKVQWTTIPNATNFIYYKTSLLATNWLAFTNFKHFYYGSNVPVNKTNNIADPLSAATNNYFVSPQVYVPNASLPDNAQTTNVWVFDAITNTPHYYKVVIWPWLNFQE